MAAFTYDATDKRSVNSLIGRVYGYMFFGLVLTAVIAFGVGILFNLWIFKTIDTSSINYGDVEANINASGAIALLVMLVVTSISLFIMSFVVHRRAMSNNKSLQIPALIYCILITPLGISHLYSLANPRNHICDYRRNIWDYVFNLIHQ